MKFVYVSKNGNRCGYAILEHLLNAGFTPMAVILPRTLTPNPFDDTSTAASELNNYTAEVKRLNGRRLRFTKSLKLLAESNSVPVFHFESIKTLDAWTCLSMLAPDLIVLGGGWHELIPQKIISLPRLGVLNTHPSLLPDFRGRDVHRWQIAAGVEKSGVTIHYIEEYFDSGDIVEQAVVNVSPNDSAHDLIEKIAHISGPIMESVIRRILAQTPEKLKGHVQIAKNDSNRYFGRWRWESQDFLKITWRLSANELSRFIRACSQESFKYNGPHTVCNGIKFIIRDAETTALKTKLYPGVIIGKSSDDLLVSTGSHIALKLKTIQLATDKGWPEEPNSARAYRAIKALENLNIKIGDCLT